VAQGRDLLVASCENFNELSCSIKRSDYQLFKNDFFLLYGSSAGF
jgi:hypothetical protein